MAYRVTTVTRAGRKKHKTFKSVGAARKAAIAGRRGGAKTYLFSGTNGNMKRVKVGAGVRKKQKSYKRKRY